MKLWQFVPIAIFIAPLYLMLGLLWLWSRLRGRSGKRTPLTRDLLRSPGESLREKIDDIWIDLVAFMAFSPFPAVVLYMMYLSYTVQEGKAPDVLDIAICLTGLAIAYLWLGGTIWKKLKERRSLTLGYEAEVAVGQELNELMGQGYRVFHDLPADGFNVDHVVVGANGVFAVETKGRSKIESNKDGREGWKVTYDGKTLQFPTWRESEPLEQAIRQAKWLREWLTSAVGNAVPVQPVLVLPGWYITRTSGDGIPVLTGKQLTTYIPRLGNSARFDSSMIQRVAHQLDQKCRNVTPRAYQNSNKNE